MSLRTVIYIRKSSKDKDENHQKLSIPRQKSDIEGFLKRHNAIVEPSERLRIVDEKQDIVKEDASANESTKQDTFPMILSIVAIGLAAATFARMQTYKKWGIIWKKYSYSS